jgi:putative peptide zinc metalloprotease protein
LHDPVRNLFFSLDWVGFAVASRLELGSTQAIIDHIKNESTLSIEAEGVNSVLRFLEHNELVNRRSIQSVAKLQARANAQKTSWWQALLHGYLFFRIPLLKPDPFLEQVLPKLQFLFGTAFLKLTFIVLALGIWGVVGKFDLFQSTLIDTFSFRGMLKYALALTGVKVLHELGHALVAKRCGCKVPTMGVAFLVMWPVAYTDVTESWKLRSNRKRLLISVAGILTELIIASWALLGWVLFPAGGFRDICFFLATTSISGTLAVNASPFMRFDGYYILCDFLGMPNLHARSFAYARWWLRKNLINISDLPPEVFPKETQRLLILFAFTTWLYRLVVFSGIAVLVYYYFFKALGIFLFGVEVWFFIAKPIWTELFEWFRNYKNTTMSNAGRTPAFVRWIISFGVILILPLDVTVDAQGMFQPIRTFKMIAPQAAQIIKLPAQDHSRITKGSQLFALHSPELDQRISLAQIHLRAMEQRLGVNAFDKNSVENSMVLAEQVKSAREDLNGLLAEKDRLNPVADFDGLIVDSEPDINLGDWLPKGLLLASLVDDTIFIVNCYVDGNELKRLEVGYSGYFIPDAPGLSDLKVEIVSIDKDAIKTLSEGALGSISGGQIVVRQQGKQLIPERSIYRVQLKVMGDPGIISTGSLRGRVVMFAWPQSWGGQFAKELLAGVLREVGF